MHIRVGHIRNRVCAPLSNLFGLSFRTQNNLGEVTREEVSKRAKYVKNDQNKALKVLPWVVEGAGGLGAGKTSGAGTRGVVLNAAIGGRTRYADTNGGESSNNGSKIHADCYPAENPSL